MTHTTSHPIRALAAVVATITPQMHAQMGAQMMANAHGLPVLIDGWAAHADPETALVYPTGWATGIREACGFHGTPAAGATP